MFVRVCLYIFGQDDEHGIETLSHSLCINQIYLQRKLHLFGHICRMDDSRKIKILVFGMMDGSNKRGRPHREWLDDIEQWCGATLQELSHAALDRQRWAAIVTMASDTNGLSMMMMKFIYQASGHRCDTFIIFIHNIVVFNYTQHPLFWYIFKLTVCHLYSLLAVV